MLDFNLLFLNLFVGQISQSDKQLIGLQNFRNNMELFESKTKLRSYIEEAKNSGKTVGFVPTMGALHEGHISLVKKSNANNDITVVSIFVNPTQFNDKNDLKNYPRTLEKDLLLLEEAGANIVFNPSEQEMYPEPDSRVFNFGQLDKVMEGAHRPGHFNGVAQIVSKLFDAVPATNAYFGLKDFQQLAIIRQLVKQLNFPINIIACDIVREPDGLAMSSRNLLLTPEHRTNAVQISQTLFSAQKQKGLTSVLDIKKWVVDTLNKNEYLEVEYFDIVDGTTLQSIEKWSDADYIVGCIAVKAGKIRLIDNVSF